MNFGWAGAIDAGGPAKSPAETAPGHSLGDISHHGLLYSSKVFEAGGPVYLSVSEVGGFVVGDFTDDLEEFRKVIPHCSEEVEDGVFQVVVDLRMGLWFIEEYRGRTSEGFAVDLMGREEGYDPWEDPAFPSVVFDDGSNGHTLIEYGCYFFHFLHRPSPSRK